MSVQTPSTPRTPRAWRRWKARRVPGWGGYDYARLAGAVDVMEIYDTGNALDLAHAFNPALLTLGTAFTPGPREVHRAWRELLHGGRGMVIWGRCRGCRGAGRRPRPARAVLAGIGGIAAPSRPGVAGGHAPPIRGRSAVLPAPASASAGCWSSSPRGTAWSDRDAEREGDDNAWRAARRQMVTQLAGLGGAAALADAGYPSGWGAGRRQRPARADAALRHRAVRCGGCGDPRLRGPRPARSWPARNPACSTATAAAGRRCRWPAWRQCRRPCARTARAAVLLGCWRCCKRLGVAPSAQVLGPDRGLAEGVDVRMWDNGGVALLSVQAARPWGAPPRVTVRLPAQALIRDVRRGGEGVRGNAVDIALDGIEPTLLVLSAAPLPGPVLSRDGGLLRVGLDGPSPARHAIRLEWLDRGRCGAGCRRGAREPRRRDGGALTRGRIGAGCRPPVRTGCPSYAALKSLWIEQLWVFEQTPATATAVASSAQPFAPSLP